MNRLKILSWLRNNDEKDLMELWRLADRARKENVGEKVYLRGVIEFGNHCAKNCHYCGLRVQNKKIKRYRMDSDEILNAAAVAAGHGYGTVVLQSGEDPRMSAQWLGDVIAAIKGQTGLAVTLSVGERSLDDFLLWKQRGADRVLLKFETSNIQLFRTIHPPLRRGVFPNRKALLLSLRDMGYEIGSGIMIGIPGQTYGSLVHDLNLFSEMDLDMIAVGPFIPNPDTPLHKAAFSKSDEGVNVPNSERLTLKVIALSRITCPTANIPATTALASLGVPSFLKGLKSGANVIMPNVTPMVYRKHYEIYPGSISQLSEGMHESIIREIQQAGRTVGEGKGDRKIRKRSHPTQMDSKPSVPFL